MPTSHVIAVKLKEDVDLAAARKLFERVYEFKEICKKPDDTTYVKAIRGGKQVTEGLLGQLAKGWEYAFLFAFESSTDLEYFLLKDPEHQKFAADFRPLLADAVALTFNDRTFD
ncbi:hypothetical protein K523DRAFT_306745 [Schizophyllum commune Tattone D]|nr:hypothetical protein K523DRAFT_306745 [Schizophyllum commune Tattone D]